MNADGEAHLTVVGLGADGIEGLGARARDAVLGAELLIGSERQLNLVPPTAATRRAWPSPIGPLIDALVSGGEGSACILASGDPMLHGIGATLARRVEPGRLTVIAAPSAFSLACARLGWDGTSTALASTLNAPPESVARLLQPGRRVVVYTHGQNGPSTLAGMLCERGLGPSRMVLMQQLGAADERLADGLAEGWKDQPPQEPYLVAIECRAGSGASPNALIPGLADDAFIHDGQITKREVRAITLALLAPLPGELLWDVGAGSGSIAIEWLRAEPTVRAIAVEQHDERFQRIADNAARLGVPALKVIHGTAPQALTGLDPPDAVFVGGGVSIPGLLEACWQPLVPGGRIVANTVTLEGERRLAEMRDLHGGSLRRISIEHAGPLGSLTAWRPQLPIVQWHARKDNA
jgi:precorrin-6B C5,15-methyltransferase / cobalt-precorrin-6B C5,C15-methyltransferase